MIAALVAVAALVVPSGFHEARTLEPAASFVAGKPAHVLCAANTTEWADYIHSAYRGSGYAIGLTPEPSTSDLSSEVCEPLMSQLHGRKTDLYQLAIAIETLTHEAIHQRGTVDEGQTDCAAMHEMPRVSVRFFHVKPGKQLRALMGQAWYYHRIKPASYQSVC